jgi:hypothetical protein
MATAGSVASAERGQGTVEYVLIVSLVVVVVFAAIFFFRQYIFALATAAWLKILEWMGS